MIFDTIARLPLYEALIPGATSIADAFRAGDASAAPFEVREKSYALKPDEERRFEVHFHTIDLMMAFCGEETIHVCPMDALTPAEHLPNGGDGRKLDGAPQGTAVDLPAGYFCAIFPGEAHMVGGRVAGEEDSIAKWVVKVPCTEDFEVQA